VEFKFKILSVSLKRGFYGCGLLLVLLFKNAFASDYSPPGFRPAPPGVHALVGAKIVIQPGEVLDSGTIVIRDGLIQAVGTNVVVPADARVWDLKGATVYAGFIEPYLVLSTNATVSTDDAAAVSQATLATGGLKFYGAPPTKNDADGPGYVLASVTPDFRAAKNFSANDKSIASLREAGFTTALVAPAKGIIRGTSALVALSDENPNQAILKPDVFQHIVFQTDADEDGAYPQSLMGVIAAVRQSFFDAQHYALDHADFAQHPQGRQRPEFDPALEALVPAASGKMPVLFEPGGALMDGRAALVGRELGLDFAIVSCGQEWRRPDLAKLTGATFIVPVNFPTLPKLPDEDDWEQVTLDELRAWDWAPENPALLRQQGLSIALTTYGLDDKKDFQKNVRLALDRGLSEEDALAALTTIPAKLCGVEDELGTIEPGKLANLTIVAGTNYFAGYAKVSAVWIDGKFFPSPPEDAGPAKDDVAESETVSTNALDGTNSVAKADDKKDKDKLRDEQKIRVARSPLDGRGPLTNPPTILVRNATIWTSGPLGILTNASLAIADGKIKAVGDVPGDFQNDQTLVIDGTGLFVTPGIVDCHSHSAILGDVNEEGLPSTPMVRIGDVVNSETPNLYDQLAGGTTTINLLHGSANPIGGQNQIIKLRDGAMPEDLKLADAPQGVKFALGENVKQSNWGEKFVTRFPQTRMGVQTFYANRFTAAQEYLAGWENYRTNGGVPPRRDLELEAIGEIIQGKRWIHCHSYRQDEILMLLRLMQSYGVKIGSFQHGLEAYKVADELAAGDVGVSSFSDWWAYKFEVYDAIPFNGTLLHDRGVLVSFNSDSDFLARILNFEAAKAVKYGGLSEAEALKFVTINPAKQLRVDAPVGSLEPGKDGDFVIWSKPPLESDTVCLQTWIDGKKYFDLSLDAARTARLQKERADLIAKAKKIGDLGGDGGDGSDDDANASFFRVSLEHQYDFVHRGCLGEVEEYGQ
jgi:imidazolonepropionase-like amidohydrolase